MKGRELAAVPRKNCRIHGNLLRASEQVQLCCLCASQRLSYVQHDIKHKDSTCMIQMNTVYLTSKQRMR